MGRGLLIQVFADNTNTNIIDIFIAFFIQTISDFLEYYEHLVKIVVAVFHMICLLLTVTNW